MMSGHHSSRNQRRVSRKSMFTFFSAAVVLPRFAAASWLLFLALSCSKTQPMMSAHHTSRIHTAVLGKNTSGDLNLVQNHYLWWPVIIVPQIKGEYRESKCYYKLLYSYIQKRVCISRPRIRNASFAPQAIQPAPPARPQCPPALAL
jgi:hypothetical protein